MKTLFCTKASINTCDFYRNGICRNTTGVGCSGDKKIEIAILGHLAKILKNQEEMKQRLTALEQQRTK
ncbi:MAG: hypothetical protein NC311_04425 [Muribaculaceae bacterium]|nr:hypothetical protein [Muribaculaceae bacterium]